MTAIDIKKYRKYTYNEAGKPIMVQLDLRNKIIRKAYEKAMEEIENMLDEQEATRRLNDGSESRPFEEFVKEYLSKNANI